MGEVQIGLYTEQQGEEQISAEQQDTNYLRQKITFTLGNETEGYSSVLVINSIFQ